MKTTGPSVKEKMPKKRSKLGSRTTEPRIRPRNEARDILSTPRPTKVLLLGSGGLKIGQAGEFDYSGSQAIKALKEEGVETILVNPNIATVQTSEGLADKVYLLPVTPYFVEQIIEKERPDSIILSFGGQTALNCGVALERSGILKKYHVCVLGTPVSVIEDTEDRARFAVRLAEIGVKVPMSIATLSVDAAERAAETIGYPVMVRAAYALGGRGSGICRTREELRIRCTESFAIAPQVLVEEWLGGWKEVEYEVMRDSADNCITICNMENVDPLGIHTGESIVVAPSQTLTNYEYHRLRELAIQTIRHLGIVGECNIQYALDPKTSDYRVIEVNARLSRSSALASKATGYPIAFVAAKIILGHTLPHIPNAVTGRTYACFEPALDYCVVKMPRWDLKKFQNADLRIGSEMKSVGEVMGIGRTFTEALQKAIRMTGVAEGLTCYRASISEDDIARMLQEPTESRIFAIGAAFKKKWTIAEVHEYTKIDQWFLNEIQSIVECAAYISTHVKKGQLASLSEPLLRNAKLLGFSDREIAAMIGTDTAHIRARRIKLKVFPYVKRIDTLAGEFPAQTNYAYLTYHGTEHDSGIVPTRTERISVHKKVIVLGSGPYRIGSSVEFDWCSVSAIREAARLNWHTIMINCNPETVSTDYDVCDRLYFDELSLERILDICDIEHPHGVIVSMGGQIPNIVAQDLAKARIPICGTAAHDIHRAEDRSIFSALLEKIGVEQPPWQAATSLEEARAFARHVGYPVLVRPSYVLSGEAMCVVHDETSLGCYLKKATDVNPAHPVTISKFIKNAKEIEVDAVAHEGEVLTYAIGEHIENAGTHSGDASIILPAQRLYIETIRQVKRITRAIAHELHITGPFNIQFLAYDNRVQVIECNLRASRSFPFASKVYKHDMIALATRAMLGAKVEPVPKPMFDIDHVGVKVAQFSFSRIKGADPRLGVEMSSTGEVACIARTVPNALLEALIAVGFTLPQKGILLSIGTAYAKAKLLKATQQLAALKCPLYATLGTAAFLAENDIFTEVVQATDTPRTSKAAQLIERHEVDLVINIPSHETHNHEHTAGFLLRRTAADHEIPLVTNIQMASAIAEALAYNQTHHFEITPWSEY